MKKIVLTLLLLCAAFNLSAQDYYFDILHPTVSYRMYMANSDTYGDWKDDCPDFIKEAIAYENEVLYFQDGFRLRYMKFFNVQWIYTKIDGWFYPTFYAETLRKNNDGTSYVIKVRAVYTDVSKSNLKYLKLVYPFYELKIEPK
jgi:hypothetical protein